MIRIGFVATLIALVVMSGIAYWTYGQLPESGDIPIHYNIRGEADGWADRAGAMRGYFVMLAVTVSVSAVLAIAPKIDPRRKGLEQGKAGYIAVWVSVLVLLVGINAGVAVQMVGAVKGDAAPAGETVRWIIAGIGVIMIVIGNFLPKTRPSFTFGVRTPWTLSSPTAWEKTHRLAGPLFMLAGAVGIVGAFTLDGIWIVFASIGPAIVAALICVVFSYFAWRSADDKDEGSEFIV